MIKHFQVYPVNFDKKNLFEEQKIFLIYLIGIIPSVDDWTLQVDYKTKLEDIYNLKHIEFEKTDIDLAKLQGKDIEKLKEDRLLQEKKKRIKELNENFGIKPEEDTEIEGLSIQNTEKEPSNKEKLWDLLEGKNLIKKPKTDK
jgi:hypothetical protein